MINSFTRSPCIGICTTTSQGDAICRGCHRTSEQVIDWNKYPEQKRLDIIREISQRKGKSETSVVLNIRKS